MHPLARHADVKSDSRRFWNTGAMLVEIGCPSVDLQVALLNRKCIMSCHGNGACWRLAHLAPGPKDGESSLVASCGRQKHLQMLRTFTTSNDKIRSAAPSEENVVDQEQEMQLWLKSW